MSQYQVPRQVTTRLEFIPGVGIPEMIAVVAGLGFGYLLSKVAAALALPAQVSMLLLFIPPIVSAGVALGGPNSLLHLLGRARWFTSRPQRLLHRAGAGRAAGRASAPAAGKASAASPLAAIAGLLGLAPRGGHAPPAPPKSVQEWFPIQDVLGGVLIRRDGSTVVVVEVEPLNLGLKSPAEHERIIARVYEAINALQQPAQFLSISRPLDLNDYVTSLACRSQELDPGRQRLMALYISYVANLTEGGEVQERRYYILLPQAGGRGASAAGLQHAHDLIARLRQADMNASLLDDLELLDLLHVWSSPVQAAFERPPGGPAPVSTLMEV